MSAFSPGSLWVYVLLGLLLISLQTLDSSHPTTTSTYTLPVTLNTIGSTHRPCLVPKTVLRCDGSGSSLCWLPSLVTYCAQTSTSSAGLTVTLEQLHSRASLLSHTSTLATHDTDSTRCPQPATDKLLYGLTLMTWLIESRIQTYSNYNILIRHLLSDRLSLPLLLLLLLLLLLSGVFARWSYPDYCSGGSVPFCFSDLLFCLLGCSAGFACIDLFLFALIDFLQTQYSSVSLLYCSCLCLLSMAHKPQCGSFLHTSAYNIDNSVLMTLV